MNALNELSFTLPQLLSFVGMSQCIYVLVYILFRTGKLRHVVLPLLYFGVLSAAFFADFAYNYIAEVIPYYLVMSWTLWLFVIPLSVLLIIQISHLQKLPQALNWLVLLVVPVAYALSLYITRQTVPSCFINEQGACLEFYMWLHITGALGGSISLLVIWLNRNVFGDILTQKAGKERYWLILALIIVNVSFLALLIAFSTRETVQGEISVLRTIFGLGFLYLVSTSLFRIYPSALVLSYNRVRDEVFDHKDKEALDKIQGLLSLEKVYHEPSYSRSDLAKELNVAEPTISRLINIHYKKSFPQLLNEYRVEDAKRLLLETDESIKTIAREVGFNSVASFNRSFKELVKQSAGKYRKNMIK